MAGDAANYDVVVTGTCSSVTSSTVSLTVNASTAITAQPTNQTACVGSAATFSVTAAGAGLSYQWRKGGVPISGATASSYSLASVAAGHAGSYDVVITGTCGTVTSNAATLTVNATTAITAQPINQAVCLNSAASFSVTATGTNLSYQWRKGGAPISGATGSSYSIAAVVAGDAASYDVVVTGACGTITSNAATLTINAATAIAAQPTSQIVCLNTPATFSVTATGTGLSYQWRKGGVPISGATASAYTIAAVTASDVASYDVVVTGACGVITSNPATLSLNTTTPLLTYSSPSPMPLASSLRVYPTSGPSGISSMVVQSITPAGFTGSITVDSQGVVAVSNAGPANAYTVTIRATGTCGATTDATFTLKVFTPAALGFLYTLHDANSGNNEIYGYQVNETTGALTLLSGFPINTGGQGSGTSASDYLAIDRANLRLYALNGGSRTISAFAINPATGALTALPFSPITLPSGITNWTGVKVHPSGSPLLAVAGPVSPGGRVASYVITATTATAAANSPYDTGTASPFSSAFSQDGNYFYTGGNSNSPFAALSVNSMTGVLTPLVGSPFSVTNTPTAFAMDSIGRLLMAQGSNLDVFTTSSGDSGGRHWQSSLDQSRFRHAGLDSPERFLSGGGSHQ